MSCIWIHIPLSRVSHDLWASKRAGDQKKQIKEQSLLEVFVQRKVIY